MIVYSPQDRRGQSPKSRQRQGRMVRLWNESTRTGATVAFWPPGELIVGVPEGRAVTVGPAYLLNEAAVVPLEGHAEPMPLVRVQRAK